MIASMLLLVVLVVVLTELRLHNDDNYLRHEDDDGDKYAHFITMLTDAGVLKSREPYQQNANFGFVSTGRARIFCRTGRPRFFCRTGRAIGTREPGREAATHFCTCRSDHQCSNRRTYQKIARSTVYPHTPYGQHVVGLQAISPPFLVYYPR